MISQTSTMGFLSDVACCGLGGPENVCHDHSPIAARLGRNMNKFHRKIGVTQAVEKSVHPNGRSQRRPILVFDVMDTIVMDPFYTVVPQFFGMTMEELFKVKHPQSWLLFERGLIDEKQMMDNFFSDGRDFDKAGLLKTMCENYDYVANMEQLLKRLKAAGYEMHTCSNYPSWYKLIENKLNLSSCVQWTFVSCDGPMKGLRKPDVEAYNTMVESLGANPEDVILVDDREVNVTGASKAGIDGIWFKSAQELEVEFKRRGLTY
ncbi:hypothetical protein BSKO_03875 [Bryopsis sp. KO-2023]|nr:hypothetical protein BSKO_03875 [Bryopsis sp. KO-2023]